MLRKLTKQMKSELFQLIAMKLVRSEVEEYEHSIKVLADALWEWKYKKDIDIITTLPDGFMRTCSCANLAHIDFLVININQITNCYMPEKLSNSSSSWAHTTNSISFTSKKRVKRDDQYSVSIAAHELPKSLMNRIDKMKKKSEVLRDKISSLMVELKGVIQSSKTIKDLREILPEFSEFYPSDNADSFPVISVSADNIQSAARKWAKNNAATSAQ